MSAHLPPNHGPVYDHMASDDFALGIAKTSLGPRVFLAEETLVDARVYAMTPEEALALAKRLIRAVYDVRRTPAPRNA